MLIRMYGEYYEVGVKFFNDLEFLEVTDYTTSIFINCIKKGGSEITISMNSKDYKSLIRHKKIDSLGI